MDDIGKFNWNSQCRTIQDRIVQEGLPPCKPRSTARSYFRDLKVSDPEGWLEKTKRITGASEQEINRELSAKRASKKKAARPTPASPAASTTLPVMDIINTMTTPEEASDFIRSSPTISEQFLIFVTQKRKQKKQPPKR